MNAEQIANSLDKPRRKGPDSWLACCPAHDDNSPSLAITDKEDTTLVYCFSGCSQENVIDTLRSMGLWPERNNQYKKSKVYYSKQELLDRQFFVVLVEADIKKGMKIPSRDLHNYKVYKKILSNRGLLCLTN